MAVAKNTLLAAYLEKDNVKLVVFKIAGKKQERLFAGQITFSEAILRDAFISDPEKFAAQIKIAFAQKPLLAETPEVMLFVPPDKTFTKTIPSSESVETFIRSLPYFKEELLIYPEEPKVKSNAKMPANLTYFAFERRLIEDFERPFLDLGKRINSVVSTINVAAEGNPKEGKYFLFVPSEKEITVAFVESGAVNEVAHFAKDVFAGRFGEFIATHNLFEVKQVYTIGIVEEVILAKVRTERGVTIDHLAQTDVYDVLMASAQKLYGKQGLRSLLPGISFPKLSLPMSFEKLQKPVLLIGALLLGFGLVFLILRSLMGSTNKPVEKNPAIQTATEAAKAEPPKPVVPEPKTADFSVRILNGTLVTGEAGRLAEKVKTAGFPVLETKNATSGAFVSTKLRVKSDTPEKITTQLQTLLSETYQSVVVETFTDPKAAIEVIIGRKK